MNVLIRADASAKIGSGHVMRCLALAQAISRDDWDVVFYGDIADALANRVAMEGFCVIPVVSKVADDAEGTASMADSCGADWIVVDGYRFGGEYQRKLRSWGRRVLFLDDYGHAGSYWASIVLNQNVGAREETYKHRAAGVHLLLGPEYAMIREEFLYGPAKSERKFSPLARRVLVTMGGMDPTDATSLVIDALGLMDDAGLEVRVAVGGSNPRADALEDAAKQSQTHIIIERNADMPTLMKWADVAISAGGSTCLELAFMGLPTACVIVGKDQVPGVEAMALAGAAADLGWQSSCSPLQIAEEVGALMANMDRRVAMSAAGRKMVDGKGADRVFAAMKEGE